MISKLSCEVNPMPCVTDWRRPASFTSGCFFHGECYVFIHVVIRRTFTSFCLLSIQISVMELLTPRKLRLYLMFGVKYMCSHVSYITSSDWQPKLKVSKNKLKERINRIKMGCEKIERKNAWSSDLCNPKWSRKMEGQC